jgi:mono/diheme cytochrome c family protein
MRLHRLTPTRRATHAIAAVMLCVVASAGSQLRAERRSQSADSLASLKVEGEEIYVRDCSSCHGADGTGDGAGPALDGNMNLGNAERVVKQILEGSPEKGMDPFGPSLSDHEIAAAATYVRTAWNNTYGAVREQDVSQARRAMPRVAPGAPAPAHVIAP